jgi:hypothetical protein
MLLVASSMQGHAVWSPQANTCLITGTSDFRWSLLVNLIVDLSLLCIMFIGVLNKRNATHLWQMLYLQGIFWILTAIATEVPSVVSHCQLDVCLYLVFLCSVQGPAFHEHERYVQAYDSPLMFLVNLILYIRCMEFGE